MRRAEEMNKRYTADGLLKQTVFKSAKAAAVKAKRDRAVKLAVTGCILTLLITIFTGRIIFTSMAKEEARELTPCYKSIEIQQGDSLWKIAGQYKGSSSMTTQEYVEKLMQMNGLEKETIHAGQYLTVIYYEENE